jgi:hypothetical protein
MKIAMAIGTTLLAIIAIPITAIPITAIPITAIPMLAIGAARNQGSLPTFGTCIHKTGLAPVVLGPRVIGVFLPLALHVRFTIRPGMISM